ncbi:putative salicylate hydroxylase [Pseudomassariella vexata]|uniref:Putative salicylate hydroxylase n=1 Tax=Pseudomassariella vexata TaxID=1141098 RepID=A0A1Y2DW97_9PEZI|nr:putative salicylate hydroxylase [Pseudomassariella vexata]ORY63469.1 putative salicylate hydroxylase [Pseudomassariella vexata]
MNGNSSSQSKFRIAIIGSGPIGKLLACAAQLPPRIELVQYEADVLPLRPSFGYGVGPQALKAFNIANAELGQKVRDQCLLGHSWMRWWHSGESDRQLADVQMPEGEVHGWIGRDELLELLDASMPQSTLPIQYGKRLTSVTKVGEQLELEFQGGYKDIVDAVWACEGINSLCRQAIQGPDHKPPLYSGMLCFRGKVPAEYVRASLGDEFATGQYMLIGTQGWHILTFPIAAGAFINIAAFCVEHDWKQLRRDYKPTKDDILAYFQRRNKTADAILNMLIDLTPGGCQRLELMHLGQLGPFTNPELNITTFGDSANAMTPHMAGSMSTGIIGVATFVQEWNKRAHALKSEASHADIAFALAQASQAYEARHKPLAQNIVDASLRQGEFGWSSGITDADTLTRPFHSLWAAADKLELS